MKHEYITKYRDGRIKIKYFNKEIYKSNVITYEKKKYAIIIKLKVMSE
jgi:hypothetical protein